MVTVKMRRSRESFNNFSKIKSNNGVKTKMNEKIENGALVIELTKGEIKKADELFKDLEGTLPFNTGSEALYHSRKKLREKDSLF